MQDWNLILEPLTSSKRAILSCHQHLNAYQTILQLLHEFEPTLDTIDPSELPPNPVQLQSLKKAMLAPWKQRIKSASTDYANHFVALGLSLQTGSKKYKTLHKITATLPPPKELAIAQEICFENYLRYKIGLARSGVMTLCI